MRHVPGTFLVLAVFCLIRACFESIILSISVKQISKALRIWRYKVARDSSLNCLNRSA